MNENVQALFQNESCEGESQTENHWHDGRKRYCYATKTVSLEW